MNTLQKIENHFVERTVLTLHDLSDCLCVSTRTVQRIVRSLDVIRSYDHNGRYFALKKLARFNSAGIWEYNQIHFSKFGTLKDTLSAIINNSFAGMNAPQIRETLGLDTRSFLYQYKDVSGIKREKIDSRYVYFSSDHHGYLRQLSNRKKGLILPGQAPLVGTVAISVLVETIKHPDFSLDQLSKHLAKQGLRVKPGTIKVFFSYYGIEKKTAVSS